MCCCMSKVELPVALRFDWNVPMCILSCSNEKQPKPNLITLGAWTITCLRPMMMGVAIAHSRYSYEILKNGDSYVLNLPYPHQADIVDYCGVASGRDHDKFDECKLTPLKSLKVYSPGVEEFALSFECSIHKEMDLGSHSFFIGKLEAIQCDESILDERGFVSSKLFNPVAAYRNKYWSLGETLLNFGEGKTRLGIK